MMIGEEGHKGAAEESNHGKGDVQMDGDDDVIDKENNAAMVNNTHINANSQDLIDLAKSKEITVIDSMSQKPVNIATG